MSRREVLVTTCDRCGKEATGEDAVSGWLNVKTVVTREMFEKGGAPPLFGGDFCTLVCLHGGVAAEQERRGEPPTAPRTVTVPVKGPWL